jgi:iron complex transport system permease protein
VTGRASRLAIALLMLAVVASVCSLLIGSRWLAPASLWSALTDGSDPSAGIAQARLDRTLLAAAVGAALALAGAILQGVTRNPLADPGILGINAGASFAMVVAMAGFGISDLGAYVAVAFLGAGLALILVHAVAAAGRDGATPTTLAICGAAVTAVLASATSAVLLLDRQTMESFRFWQVGTVSGRDLSVLTIGAPFLAVGIVLGLLCIRLLDAAALGDDLARGLGRRVGRDRAVVAVAVVLLAGTATALAGPIAFVGLLVPHAVRALAGPGHRTVLPLCLLGGAVLTLLADTVGRVLLPPAEIQVGVMVALIGGPAFVMLVRRGRTVAL